jgi:hypothetical protein
MPLFVPSQNVKSNLTGPQAQKPISNLSVASAAFTHQQAMQNARALSIDPIVDKPISV